MTVGSTAYLQVQWIEVFYNTSGPFKGAQMARRDEQLQKRGGHGCKVVCGVDGNASTVPGTPVVLSSAARQQEILSFRVMIVLFIFLALNYCT